jgi:hypothetical protein
MSFHPHFVRMRELEDKLRTVKEETFVVYQMLTDAQQVTHMASLAYFALTADSDTTAAILASVAYTKAIINEEPIRLSFTAKMAELQTVKDVIQEEEENWTE